MVKNIDNDSNWLGWVGFASFMLMLGGTFSAITGLVALFQDTVFVQTASSAVWILDYNQWGWAHILIGILAIIAAGSLLSGHMYGRIIAIIVAFVSAIANMAFVPVYPIWSIAVIVIDILVIYAVAVHAGELKEEV